MACTRCAMSLASRRAGCSAATPTGVARSGSRSTFCWSRRCSASTTTTATTFWSRRRLAPDRRRRSGRSPAICRTGWNPSSCVAPMAAARYSATSSCSRLIPAGATLCRSTSTSTATPAAVSAPVTRLAGPAWSPSCSNNPLPNPTPRRERTLRMNYDAIVIGAGQGGVPLSQELARAGRRTALVEREHVGGCCINVGCTPTKTMVASARLAYLARRGADYGVQTGPVSIDMLRVRQRKRDIVTSFRGGSELRIANTPGLELIMGEARFSGRKTMQVNGSELHAELIFINTGGRPSKPPIQGLEQVPSLDSTSIMELDAVPEHLLVLGGGYVGLEFGQMFRRFGSAVTVVQRGPRLLGREDADVAGAVADILREEGVTVLLETDTVRIEGGSSIRLVVRSADGERVLEGSHLLVATGR